MFIFSVLSLRYLLDLVEMSNCTLPEVKCKLGAGEDNFGSHPSIGVLDEIT